MPFPAKILRLRFAATAAAALAAFAATGGAIPVLSQVTIEEALAGGTIVRGRIAELFGDHFLMEDGGGRLLVETGSAADKPPALAPGQSVTVTGRLKGRVLEARSVTLASGEAPVASAPTAPSPPDALADALGRPADAGAVRATIEAAGFRVAGSPVRHEKDTEIPVRDNRGRAWVAWLDRFGRLTEIEIVDYDDDRVPDSPGFSAFDIPRMVEREGFRMRGTAERRAHHFEALATNARSETIELHIDFAGQIYKQVWVR